MAWKKIEDSRVNNIWVCEECKGEVAITPDWYMQNGTPVCCDDDMVYSHTVVNVKKTGKKK